MRGPETLGDGQAPLRAGQKAVLVFLALWLAFQLLFPWRHFLYPGYPSWNEQGHRFSWRMKLRDKNAEARFEVRDPRTGEVWEIDTGDYLSPRQERKMSGRPDMILQFAHHLRDLWADERDIPGAEVRARVLASLNGRAPSLLIDPERNLAAVERNLGPADWILPMEGTQVPSAD